MDAEEIKKSTDYGTLPKKIAALEVYKVQKIVKAAGIGIIASNFITAIVAVFSVYGGSIAAGIFAVLGAFMVKKAVDKMHYFEENYGIKPDKK